MDVDFDSARAADDAGGGVLLRRARPPQERIEHDELRGVFAQKALNTVSDGLLFGNPGQLVTQAIAAVAAMFYSGLMSFVLLKIIGAVTPLRHIPAR